MNKTIEKNIVRRALEFAVKCGAQACRAALSAGSSNVFEYRNTQLDKLQQASENKLTIELFVDGRYGVYSTNRTEQDGLEPFIRQAIAATRYLTEDPCRRLPGATLYYKGNGEGLDQLDSRYDQLDTTVKMAAAKAAIDEIYGADPRIISVSSEFSDGKSYYYMADSNGFEGEETATFYNLSASVSLKDQNDARPEAYWFDVSTHWDDLQRTGIGQKALQRAVQKLGQRKIRSGKYPMLVDNLNTGRLLAPLIAAMYGNGLQQKNSFLLNKLHTRIASEKLSVTDEPHIPRAIGARWFDEEGIATVKRPVIAKGMLSTYFIDTWCAGKMNTEPTVGGPSVLTFEPGDKNLEQLCTLLKKGVLVTGFNGGNSNSSTGDFSFGVEGFLIENGQITTPIAEMNITGNLLSLWQQMAETGNDARLHSSWRTPSVLFDSVDFSGY